MVTKKKYAEMRRMYEEASSSVTRGLFGLAEKQIASLLREEAVSQVLWGGTPLHWLLRDMQEEVERQKRQLEHLGILIGNGNRELGREVCDLLGIAEHPADIGRFPNGEVRVDIEKCVRDKEMFVFQSLGPPVNENCMEMYVICQALVGADAQSIRVVNPCEAYGRQDRKARRRQPISARLVAMLLEASCEGKLRSVMRVEPHSRQSQGFHSVPVAFLFSYPVIIRDLMARFGKAIKDLVFVSPDIGGAFRVNEIIEEVGADMAVCQKKRNKRSSRRKKNQDPKILKIIGDVRGAICILIDDMIDGGGTIVRATEALLKAGASRVLVYVTHGIFSGNAVERIAASDIEEVVVSNTICPRDDVIDCPKFRVMTLGPEIAEAIGRIHRGKSVSAVQPQL